MANVLIANFLFTNAGVPIEGATVDLLARNTTTPVLATTTTSAAGYWAFSHATEGRFDVRITNGSSVRWHMYDASAQFTALEVQTLRVRNPAFTFDYDIVPGAITADRQLNLPVITGTDTLAVLGLAQTFTADKTFNDSVNLTFGTGGDVDIYYDGTDLIIKPAVVGTGGVVLDQGTNDGVILSFRSPTDVAHGVTTVAATDVYGRFAKNSATNGGLLIHGLADTGNLGLVEVGIAPTVDTAKTTSGLGPIALSAQLSSGTGVIDVSADGNLAVIRNNATTRFIFDAEGSGHADIEWVAFDAYDDLALIHDVEQHLLDRESAAGTYNRHALEAVGIIGRDSWHFENGRPRAMVNFTKLAMLHHGALMQIGTRLDDRDQRIAALEGEIAELRHRLEAGRN